MTAQSVDTMEPERNGTENDRMRIRFHSILFPASGQQPAAAAAEDPECFHDLFLDQIVAAIITGWEEYDLGGFYRQPLSDPDSIVYRQEVMDDLDDEPAMALIREFSGRMRTMRHRLEAAEKSYYPHEKHYWFLDACDNYCHGVEALDRGLHELPVTSRGLLAFRDDLAACTATGSFTRLAAEMRGLRSDLGAIRYELLIEGSSITVLQYDGGPDYSAAIEETFEKFRRGTVRDYLI